MFSWSAMGRFLSWWNIQVLRFPKLLIFLMCLLGVVSLLYTVENLGVNTNTDEMLSPDLPFQKNRKRIDAEFPQNTGVIMFVVEAPTPEQTAQVANFLVQELVARPKDFLSAYVPTENDFLNQQALLFLTQDETEELAEKLIDAQPLIGYLAQHYHLQGLFDIIIKSLKKTDTVLSTELDPLLRSINTAMVQQLKGQPYKVSWQSLLAIDKLNTKIKRTIVIAKPQMNFAEILPAKHALTNARNIINLVMHNNLGSKIRMTGEIVLEHEELEGVSKGAVISGLISLFLVCASLWFGLRSFKLLLVVFIVLILGLIFTAGFATLAIGHLNLISIAFAVLYIGLGVDYAIHICLHYRECLVLGMENHSAINYGLRNVRFSIFLCTVTTSIGFLAFVPTDFAGVSELGIISSAGMFIAMGVSLTLLPALLTILTIKNVKPIRPLFNFNPLVISLFNYSSYIKVCAIIFALISLVLLTQLSFDSNPINLRDPNSESVITIKELLTSHTDSPFALSVLTQDLESAEKLAIKLEQLPSVRDALFIDSFVAKNQAQKLEIIYDLNLIFGNQLDAFTEASKPTYPKQALLNFNTSITKILANKTNLIHAEILQQLQFNSSRLLANHSEQSYHTLEQNILSLLPVVARRLSVSLAAMPYKLSDLPDYISRHWLSNNGFYKILITPEYNQNNIENLKQFVAEVKTIAPTASGLSVIDQASGIAVVNAFIQAFSWAIITIFLLLLFIFRDFKSTLLVIGPLLLAGLLTVATNVLLGKSFNFASIIALPLLMGMGIDSSIHIMHSLKSELVRTDKVLRSNTARGVFFSALTTLCSFSSLTYTSHVGTFSMGLLLAIGIFFTLVCTLIVLPAFYGKNL